MLTHGSPSQLEAIADTEVSLLNPTTFRGLMRTRPELTYAVAVYLAESTYEAVLLLEHNLFRSVQQRVSRHLLEMASPTTDGLVVQTDQAALANAIGSVREVVARALQKLSDAGAIRRSRRQIWIEDPTLLRTIAAGRDRRSAAEREAPVAAVPVPGAGVRSRQAWSQSILGDQDLQVRDALLGDAAVVRYPAGAQISRGGDSYRVLLVHSGRLRAKVTAWDGREVTVRYVTAGQFAALPAMLTHGAPSSMEAVTPVEATLLDPALFRRLLRTRADLAYEVAVHLAELTYQSVLNLEENLFGSVQARVCRHLLEMAVPTVNGLVVHADQADLANAIGSVREVVSRALKKLADVGTIRRYRRQIWIEDPRSLRALAEADLGTRSYR
ncbi:Crp/Fnr family transcriptional regulator [Pseudonocardia thermophila]|nr:helix-turn-helix domain-containing protein [Pseudonocardia thermophila]